jgi:hypothetical protein
MNTQENINNSGETNTLKVGDKVFNPIYGMGIFIVKAKGKKPHHVVVQYEGEEYEIPEWSVYKCKESTIDQFMKDREDEMNIVQINYEEQRRRYEDDLHYLNHLKNSLKQEVQVGEWYEYQREKGEKEYYVVTQNAFNKYVLVNLNNGLSWGQPCNNKEDIFKGGEFKKIDRSKLLDAEVGQIWYDTKYQGFYMVTYHKDEDEREYSLINIHSGKRWVEDGDDKKDKECNFILVKPC